MNESTQATPTGATYPLGVNTYARHDVIGAVELTPNMQNTAVRVGRLHPSGGWEQHSYVVLTPGERARLIADLVSQDAELSELLRTARDAAEGDSNDAEISAWQAVGDYLS